MIVIGGRTQHPNDKVLLEMYDTDLSDWFKFFPVQRFRHSSWIIGQKVFIHGGFEPEAPSVPTDVICVLNLKTLLQNSKLKNSIEDTSKKPNELQSNSPSTNMVGNRPNSSDSNMSDNVQIKFNRNATVSSYQGERSEISMNNFQEIGKRLKSNKPGFMQDTDISDSSLADSFINTLLKPSEQRPTGQTQFPFGADLIRKLCEQTIEVLQKRPIVLKLRAPIKIFGDIHGQY